MDRDRTLKIASLRNIERGLMEESRKGRREKG